MLVHYWDELNEYRQALSHADERKHLDLLFEFMEHELKSDRDTALNMIQNGQIAFKNAWVIYRPGDVLYREYMGEPWLLVCQKAVYEEHNEDGPYLEIHAKYTDQYVFLNRLFLDLATIMLLCATCSGTLFQPPRISRFFSVNGIFDFYSLVVMGPLWATLHQRSSYRSGPCSLKKTLWLSRSWPCTRGSL